MENRFSIPIRRQAPLFSAQAVLPDNTVDTLSLFKQRGRHVVLVFYPMDFSAVCPTEIIALEKKREEFNARDAVVWAVSTDSVNVHQAWKQLLPGEGGVGRIGFPLISDSTHEISRSYGVLTDEGTAARALFIIDRSGVVRHVSVNDFAQGRNISEIIRILDALILFEKEGEVCPAGWKKGERAIVPTREGIADYLSRLD